MFGQPDGTFSRRTILSAILVAAIVLAGIVLTILILTGDEDSAADPSAGDPTPTKSSESVCGLDDEDSQDPPTSSPAVDEWGGRGPLPVPMSEEYGPGRQEDGVHACFSGGPRGALMAATSFAADISDPGVSAADARERFIDPESAQMLEGTSTVRGRGISLELAGYRFVSYSPDEAVISLAFSSPTETGEALVGITYTMRWSEGDWRAAIPPSGEVASTQLPNLSGYVKWGPNA